MREAETVLLVGGTGFVGRHLAPALARAFPHARHIQVSRDAAEQPDCRWHTVVGDITREADVAAIVAQFRPRIIVHLAAQSSVATAVGAAELTWRANLSGTLALASAVAKFAPDATFLFTSTGEVYGSSFNAGPADESTPAQPQNAYAASKLAAEWMLRDVLPRSTRLIVTRAFNHTGPGQDERFVLPSFAAQIARIEAGLVPPVMQVGNLTAERDFLPVGDVVDAYIRLLLAPPAESRSVINVASGRPRSIASLLRQLTLLAQTPFDLVEDPGRLRPSEIPRAFGTHARLTAATGWQPTLDIDGMLAGLLAWWRRRVRS